LDPSGNWLVAAGQNSNDLEVLSVDQSTGKLNQVGHTVAVGSPVCILFGR
jgi:6-phosphogluconolactonase